MTTDQPYSRTVPSAATPETIEQRITRAADRLEALMQEATPGPWVETGQSSRYGGLVGPASSADPDEIEGYGGALVGESLTRPNRALIAVLRGIAPGVVASLRAAAPKHAEDIRPETVAVLNAILGPITTAAE